MDFRLGKEFIERESEITDLKDTVFDHLDSCWREVHLDGD